MLTILPNVNNFNPTVVIYHANCSDGFGAAYIARHYSQLNDRNIRLIPYSHKDKIADFLENQNVVFIDCCYERNDLLHVKEIANKVLVLDHHITVDRGCGDLDFVHIDQTRSGVRLAWNFFFFEQIIPVQFLHIEDRDLFRFSLDYTKFFCAALDSYEMSFDVWDQYFSIDMSESHYAIHIQIGRSIVRYKETIIKQLTKNSHKIDFFGHLAVWCNVPFPLHSDAGNFLKETHPDCKFSVCIGIEDLDIIYLSFRSLNFNVLDIVESLGGGGHPNAAGCRITREKFNELFNQQKTKADCDKLIANEDFLWCDKQDTDEKINRINEQWNLFDHLYFCDQFTLAFNYGHLANSGEFDYKYYDDQWELWHCNY